MVSEKEEQRTFRFTLNVQWGLFSSVWLVFVTINCRVINCWAEEGSWLCGACAVMWAGKQEAWWNFEADKELNSSQPSFIHKKNQKKTPPWFIQVFCACCCQYVIVFGLIGLRWEVLGLLSWSQKITSFQLSFMWLKFTWTPDIHKGGVMRDNPLTGKKALAWSFMVWATVMYLWVAQLNILGGCGTDQLLLLLSAVFHWWSNSVLRQLTTHKRNQIIG